MKDESDVRSSTALVTFILVQLPAACVRFLMSDLKPESQNSTKTLAATLQPGPGTDSTLIDGSQRVGQTTVSMDPPADRSIIGRGQSVAGAMPLGFFAG